MTNASMLSVYIEMTVISSLDPYDLWSTPWGVRIRRSYYEGNLSGKVGAIGLSVLDLMFPTLSRSLLQIKPRSYPILSAHEYLRQFINDGRLKNAREALTDLKTQALGYPEAVSWGLGFHWMSKNGLYGPEVPFVTHTPYVMEVLLMMAEDDSIRDEAIHLFYGTWGFLESLKVMYQKGDELAVSYAPVDEPHIVVNANSYAAYAYAMHAKYGRDEVRTAARSKAIRLINWVIKQQNENGSWFYLADRGPWDMIDGFHSCIIIKNLRKVVHLLSETHPIVNEAIDQGWEFIREKLFDRSKGLCRRYYLRPRRDPYVWELYDQAEYLCLLVDFGMFDEACEFAEHVENRFKKGDHWYCRIDILGRRWGRDFLRWGVAPFWYHRARLDQALAKAESQCAG